MTAEQWTKALGRQVYGAGVMAMGLACLAFDEFDTGQPVPAHFPARAALAYVAGGIMVAAALAVEWAANRSMGAGVLTAYYSLMVILLMNGRVLLTGYGVYGNYENLAEQVAIAAAGLIVFAAFAEISEAVAARLMLAGRVGFGLSSLVWGGAHFVYMNLTAPLVPKWLPPSQEFWGYATGAGFLLAGAAIVIGVQARLAAVVLTAMLASFAVLVHEPILWADHASPWNWTESAVNLALIGAAWVVADSLARPAAKRN